MASHFIRIHRCIIYHAQDWRIPNRFYYISVILWYIRIIEKVVHIDAISSITIECIVTAPAGLIYVIYLWQQHQMSFGLNMSSFWLLFSGAITAIPLILFSSRKTYSTFVNRIYSRRLGTKYSVCKRHICFQRAF